ncbi:MAG: prepilin-type N-terminal cleavage/methylation domain-containing protein [Thermodesulfobacteriota bacterium]
MSKIVKKIRGPQVRTDGLGFHRRPAFTLIEIIAVLVILGILAAIAIPKYINLRDESGLKAATGGVSATQSALYLYYSKNLLTDPSTASNFNCSLVVTEGLVSVQELAITVTGSANTNCAINVVHIPTGQLATGTWERP